MKLQPHYTSLINSQRYQSASAKLVLWILLAPSVGSSQEQYQVQLPERIRVSKPHPIPREQNNHHVFGGDVRMHGGEPILESLTIGLANPDLAPEEYAVSFDLLRNNDRLGVLGDIYRVSNVNERLLERVSGNDVPQAIKRTPGSFALPTTKWAFRRTGWTARLNRIDIQLTISDARNSAAPHATVQLRTNKATAKRLVRSGDEILLGDVRYRVCKIVPPDDSLQVYGWIELLPLELHIPHASQRRTFLYQGLRFAGYDELVRSESAPLVTNLAFHASEIDVRSGAYEFHYHSPAPGQLVAVLGTLYRVQPLTRQDEVVLRRVLESEVPAGMDLTPGAYILPVGAAEQDSLPRETAALHHLKLTARIELARGSGTEYIAQIRMKSPPGSQKLVDRLVTARVGEQFEVGTYDGNHQGNGKSLYRVAKIVPPSVETLAYGWIEIVPVN